MTFGVLLAGDLDAARLRGLLAEAAGVPVGDVDVAPAGVDDRNWDTAVLGTYEPVYGDATYTIDVYLTARAPNRELDVPEVARRLAEGLGLLVMYSAGIGLPSAFWLVTPDGERTRARLEDVDPAESLLLGVPPEGGIAVRIDAVERPIAALPNARVEPLPEVIREHRMPTPVTEALRSRLATDMLIPEVGDPLWSALSRLGAWEALTERMARGWPPDGWYPKSYYEEDLAYRDQLDSVPGDVAALVGPAIEQVDEAFRAGTRESAAGAGHEGWWWRRVPEPAPWLTEPGRNATA